MGEVQRPANGAHRQSVLLGDVVDVIGGNHAAGTGHVLHEKVRITGNILAQVAGVGARPLIVRVAGLITDDDADGFALVVRRLGRRPFKVQGVQEFKDREDQESEHFERLNF